MEEKRKILPWYWWPVAGLLVLVAYLLSSGPVVWLLCRLELKDSLIFTFVGYVYLPLMFIGVNEIHPLSDWLIPYWHWWGVWDI